MSLAAGLGKHSRRCLATPARSLALWGAVTVFTGQDLATVIYEVEGSKWNIFIYLFFLFLKGPDLPACTVANSRV